MKLRELLDKIGNEDFLLTVSGLCDEYPYYNAVEDRSKKYWKPYENMEIKNISVTMTNFRPELIIDLIK